MIITIWATSQIWNLDSDSSLWRIRLTIACDWWWAILVESDIRPGGAVLVYFPSIDISHTSSPALSSVMNISSYCIMLLNFASWQLWDPIWHYLMCKCHYHLPVAGWTLCHTQLTFTCWHLHLQQKDWKNEEDFPLT
jgi:hypothetical protein